MSAISKILQINWSVFDLGPAFQDVDVTVTSETGVMVEQDDSKLQVFTGDYGKDNCDKLVDLVTKWSTDYTNILSTAIHGGRDISSLPIITITFRFTDNDATVNGKGLLVQKFTPLLNTLLQDNFETTTTAIPQVGCRYHDFSSLQVAATTSAALPQTVSNALASIAAYRSRIKAIPRFKPTKAQIRAASSDDSPSTQTILSYIPPKSLIPPISISVDAVSRIIDADGDDEIHEVIQTIVSSIAKIGAETSERSLIAHMVASGLVSVGQRMWDAYLERMDEYANNQDDKIDSATLVQYLVTAAGGISAIAPLAQNISKALNAFFLRPQDAKSLLLVMNVTNNSFTVGADSIGDGGERDILSSGIPKGGDETRLAVPCGLYAYGRYTPAISRGPWSGVTFVCDDGSTEIDPVGIGMSCDNTSKGMQNSIVASQEGVDQKSLAKLVASFAKTNEAAEGYVDSGSATFTFRRCLPWGNAHYAFCLIVTTEDSGTSSDSESD